MEMEIMLVFYSGIWFQKVLEKKRTQVSLERLVTDFKLKFAEKPRVHNRRLFQAEICRSFDWSHAVSLFFRSLERAVCLLIVSNSPIKIIWKQKPSTRIILRKEWSEHVLTKICDSRKSEEKQEGLQGWAGPKSSISLVILVKIPPCFSNKSRVLHLVCTHTGVYTCVLTIFRDFYFKK